MRSENLQIRCGHPPIAAFLQLEGNLLVLNQNVSEAVSERMIFITDGKGSRTGMARPPHFEFNFRLSELDLIDAHVDKAISAK